ncbi:MAG: hypothetical protein RQ798_03765 [Candidatus Caldarchaeales archaeon]|nr:hypothetical protein [Candidatus Caldarchaeales archaeon]MDT7915643.1 hypothetical protein [Candidatus Caldarchaeales archaeon]
MLSANSSTLLTSLADSLHSPASLRSLLFSSSMRPDPETSDLTLTGSYSLLALRTLSS